MRKKIIVKFGIILFCALICVSLAGFGRGARAMDTGANKVNSLNLTSLSVDNSGGETRLTFGIEAPNPEIRKAARKSLEYFFIGLVLPDDKFWVNLNPKEPYRMLDSALAETDLGRIMLYADLRLKRDVCELLDPNKSEVGVEYWNRLYLKARESGALDKIPAVKRIWIVPDKAEVYKAQNRISIVKSRLRVRVEENKGGGPLQDYALSLMEELILPRLNEKVNEGASYADLREVYRALLLARWYKEEAGREESPLFTNAAYNVIKDTETDFHYRPDQIYRDYLNSYKKGEYTFRNNPSNFYPAMTIMQYFIGGINFKRTPEIISAPVTPGRPDFTVTVVMPQGWQEKTNSLQLVKNSMKITLDAAGGIASLPEFTLSEAEGVARNDNGGEFSIGLPSPVSVVVSVGKERSETREYRVTFGNKL